MGNFKIGEKVVCVEPTEELVKGEIYTISFVGEAGNVKVLEATPIGHYLFFWDWRFRKLDYEFAENLLAEISEAMKSEIIKN